MSEEAKEETNPTSQGRRTTSRRTRQVIRYNGVVVRNYGTIINENIDEEETGNIDENIDEDEDNITIGNIENENNNDGNSNTTKTNDDNNNNDHGQGQGQG